MELIKIAALAILVAAIAAAIVVAVMQGLCAFQIRSRRPR
jgi:hypothetical protein